MREGSVVCRPGWPGVFAAAGAIAVLLATALAGSPSVAGGSSGCPNSEAPAHSITLRQLRNSISCLIQTKREERGRPRLDTNAKLRAAAKRHNDYMLNRDCFEHKCPGERDLKRRVRSTGYADGATAWSVAENLGFAPTAGAMIRAWMDDEFHRQNLLDPDFEDFGVAVGWGCPVNGCPEKSTATYTVNFAWRDP